MNLRAKLTLTSIALIAVGVVLVSIFSSSQIKTYIDQRIYQTQQADLSVLAALFESGKLHVDSAGTTEQEVRQMVQTLDLRLTVIGKNGTVLMDTEVPHDSLGHIENHSERPEIQRARAEGTGIDRRRSHTLEQDFLYAARRITGPSLGMLDSGYIRLALPLTEVESVNDHVQTIIWSVGLFTVLISIAVSYAVSQRISRPILAIAETAAAIRQGNLQKRVAVTSNDEIGTLANAINDMADKLETDISQLRKLERVRSEFLANVSHELRTPIFSIQGFIETLLDGALDDPAVNKEFLEKAHKQATRLNTLLSDLIEISRIESGDMKMSFRFFPVTAFLEQVVEEMQEQATRKQIGLALEQAFPGSIDVYGDRERLKQVLINLIDNAIKYTEHGGKVTVRADLRETVCRIQVNDTGCGIAPEHQSRIFERFYRVDRDRSREVGGTGLGLAIVKHIVEAHGSAITVSSAVGKGSTFEFSLKR